MRENETTKEDVIQEALSLYLADVIETLNEEGVYDTLTQEANEIHAALTSETSYTLLQLVGYATRIADIVTRES